MWQIVSIRQKEKEVMLVVDWDKNKFILKKKKDENKNQLKLVIYVSYSNYTLFSSLF